MRPRIAFSIPGELSFPAQKSSGALIRSVLNESTDFTNPDCGLLSNRRTALPKALPAHGGQAVRNQSLLFHGPIE